METPEGMISLTQFSRQSGVSADKVKSLIKDGTYRGRVINNQWYVYIEQNNDQLDPSVNENHVVNGKDLPALVVVFYILAGLSLLMGVILLSSLWPESYRYDQDVSIYEYIPSLTWFSAGIIEFALFSAFGQGLLYLKRIAENTEK